MERQIRNNNIETGNRSEASNMDNNPLERFAGAEMADRGPKSVSGFTDGEDENETRPVTNMYAEPGGEDDDDLEDDDDMDLDDDDFDDDDEVIGDDEIVADDEVEPGEDLNDDDLLLDDDEEDEDDDL